MVYEAVAAGLTVLLWDDAAFVGAAVSGKNGFLIKEKGEFVRRLTELVENQLLRYQFAENSLKIAQKFDIQVTTKKLIDYYEYGVEQHAISRGKSRRYKVINSVDEIRSRLRERLREFREKIQEHV